MMMMMIIIIIIIKAIQTIPEQHTGKAKITAILGTAHILRKVLMQSTYKTSNTKERYK